MLSNGGLADGTISVRINDMNEGMYMSSSLTVLDRHRSIQQPMERLEMSLPTLMQPQVVLP